jgi:hypothetical protein
MAPQQELGSNHRFCRHSEREREGKRDTMFAPLCEKVSVPEFEEEEDERRRRRRRRR